MKAAFKGAPRVLPKFAAAAKAVPGLTKRYGKTVARSTKARGKVIARISKAAVKKPGTVAKSIAKSVKERQVKKFKAGIKPKALIKGGIKSYLGIKGKIINAFTSTIGGVAVRLRGKHKQNQKKVVANSA
jgi:ribosome biogenesis protein Nip4